MKKIIIGLISGLIIVTACSTEKNESSESFEFNLTMDTVVVDPGEGQIDLRYGLSYPELSNDGKFLFNYVFNSSKFDKINLESLTLEKTLQFEREGPNGMGSYIGGYSLTSEEQIMIWSYGLFAVFDESGKKVKDLNLDKFGPQEIQGASSFPMGLVEHPNDPSQIYGFFIKSEPNEFFLMKFDLEKETYHKIPLPETEKLDEFNMEFTSGGAFSVVPFPIFNAGRIIMTNDAFNEAYVYDIPLDSLYLIPWDSKLTDNKNETEMPSKVDLEKGMVFRRKFFESINFMTPKWDPVSQQFARLSYINKYGEELDEYGDPNFLRSEVFLTLLDKNLKIINETKLEHYTKEPSRYFFLNNTIWLYENIDDELGFVRIKID
ncbi:DUF4221 family protein [Belliella kenyensis]|uniref:DUF4221 family protein n=1 Tax=Belliella kenyensis TaxID=1472724 RepID=A0ABV8EJ62_9BACT|nr:DUF4221 family protein [Belliella kenyensis]MCH7401376.1 DUF4221 domain-containing protein [Belliella kenyensis]MDN3602819.1 DUF4221 family protein [Belliella kenyensis]